MKGFETILCIFLICGQVFKDEQSFSLKKLLKSESLDNGIP